MVEPARLAFQQGQVMNRLEEELFLVPATRMPSDQPIFPDQSHFADRGDHR